MPPAEGFLLEFGNCDGAEKRRGMGEKSLTICSKSALIVIKYKEI